MSPNQNIDPNNTFAARRPTVPDWPVASAAPAPPQPALAAAADVEKRLFELVNRLSRISGAIVARPAAPKDAAPASGAIDLSSCLASANASINTAFSIVNQIESDLIP